MGNRSMGSIKNQKMEGLSNIQAYTVYKKWQKF